MQSGVNESSLYISNKPGLMHLCKCVLAVLFVFFKGVGGKWGGLHAFVHAEQQLQAQSDACVPSQREDANVASNDGRPQKVLHRRGPVRVPIKHLRKDRKARLRYRLVKTGHCIKATISRTTW